MPGCSKDALLETVMKLCEDTSDLLPNEIPVLDEAPTASEFLRNYLSQNTPCIIKNGVGHWPALHKWTNCYLRSTIGDKMVTVAVTPNGYADSVVDDMFMLPEERTQSFDEFLQEMEHPNLSRVLYLQKQNNCLMDEFAPLINDVDIHMPWMTAAIGDMPDAANFWMGDRRAVTKFHKDHYENIYCVVNGQKEFTLYPPVAAAWMPYEWYKKGVYYFEDGNFKVREIENEQVKWIKDPFNLENEKYQMFEKTKCYQIFLDEGDILYLPALWFHQVKQTHACIAVNFWYDMSYDYRWPYFNFLENMARLL